VLVRAVCKISDRRIIGIVGVFSIGLAATGADRSSFFTWNPNVREINPAK
jgi:hypothetical protein